MTVTGDEHARFRDALAAASVDALTPEERAELETHLATCDSCRTELAALRATAAELPFSLPGIDDSARSARTRERLLARAREAGQTPAIVRRAASGNRRAEWLAAASIVVAVASLAAAFTWRTQRDDARTALREQIARDATQLAARDSTLASRERVLGALTGPAVSVIDLASAQPTAPWARMFWDRATGRWTFVAHRLPQPGNGRTYQLWLVTPTQKISAGTFAPDARGDAVVQATYALDQHALQAVAVTDEPAGGVPQPTGAMIVAGSPATK